MKKLPIAIALVMSPVIVNAQFDPVFELSSLNGNNGFVLKGVAESDFTGISVSGAGDINGDGLTDLLIGAFGASPNGNYSGASHVVFGNSAGFGSTLELSSLNGSNGFVMNGVAANDFAGNSVSSAGDINGDGLTDLLIGAVGVDPNGKDSAGASYVVFGSSTGFDSTLELSSLNGSNGFVMNGVTAGDLSGASVSILEDINGDGLADLLIGAFAASPNGNTASGASYVVFGKSSGFTSTLELSDLNGSDGFVMNGVAIGDQAGDVGSAGDINGDGFADLLIGASGADVNGNYSGSSYLVFGSSEGFASTLDLSGLNGSNGFVMHGAAEYNFTGISVSGAGDINGDGIDDMILASINPSPVPGDIASFVVFGSSSGFGSVLELSDLNGSNGFVLKHVVAGDATAGAVSGAGDINGDGIDDLLIGASGVTSNGVYSGASYVVFGNSTGFDSVLELSDLNGNNGFVLNGISANDRSGASVSSAGDINGDGIDDLLIGASGVATYDTGASYVVFGKGDKIFTDGFE